MIPRYDSRKTIEFDHYYIIQPDFRFWRRRYNCNDGKPVPEDFEYNSGTNPWRLSIHEMKEMTRNL